MNVRRKKLIVALVASATMVACGGDTQTATEGAADQVPGEEEATASERADSAGGGMTIGIGAVTRTLDPATTNALNDYLHYNLIYDRLLKVEEGEIVPEVAAGYEASDDLTEWRISLRDGFTFSDGSALDAADVVYSFERIVGNPESPARIRISDIEEVRAEDEGTVVFTLGRPVANFPVRLTQTYLLPEGTTPEDAESAVGSGPYEVKSFDPNQSLELSRREEFGREGEYGIDSVTFRAIPERSTRVNAIISGEIEIAHDLLPEQIEQVEGQGGRVVSEPTGRVAQLFFQTWRDTPVSDTRVREAIAHAIDRPAVTEAITGGYGGKVQGQTVGPNSLGFNPDIEPRKYDPERARELLAEAGYPDGFSVQFDHSNGLYFRDAEIAALVSEYLRDVGIDVELNNLEGGAWQDTVFSGEWGPINYWPIQDAPGYDLSFTMEAFRTDSVMALTQDAEIDRLIQESLEIPDREKRDAFLQEFAEYLHDEVYFVSFHHDPGLHGVGDGVEGVEFTPELAIELSEASLS